jgi:hypothetical protein
VFLQRAIVAGSQVVGRGGSGRRGFGCWLARVSAGARQPENDSECPLSLQHAAAEAPFLRKEKALCAPRASFLEVSPRSRGKDEPRQGQRPATTKIASGFFGGNPTLWGRRRSRSVQVSCGWLASSEHTGLLPAPQGVAQARVAPVTAPPGNGVSLAGRVRDCVVRARVLIAKTDAEGAQTMGAPSSTLRQQKSGLGGRPTPRGGDRSSAEGEERFGARWNGLTNESLVVPPVRHHGPGATDAVARVLATLGGPAGSPALPSPSRGAGLRAGAPKRVSLAQVCEPLR